LRTGASNWLGIRKKLRHDGLTFYQAETVFGD